MGTFLLVLVVFGVLLAAMSIGVMFGRKPISGTCGGISAVGLGGPCEICGGDTSKCDEENGRVADEPAKSASLAYNAMDDARRDDASR